LTLAFNKVLNLRYFSLCFFHAVESSNTKHAELTNQLCYGVHWDLNIWTTNFTKQ